MVAVRRLSGPVVATTGPPKSPFLSRHTLCVFEGILAMSNTTTPDNDHVPKHVHRDEYEHLESLDHLGLIRDTEEPMTPVDRLFAPQEEPGKPKPHQQKIL